MQGVFITRDLMFQSRVVKQAADSGVELVVCADWSSARQAIARRPQTRLLIADLAAVGGPPDEMERQLSETIGQPDDDADWTTLGYAPHMQVRILEAAKSAGFQFVWTRGQFDQQFGSWLTGQRDRIRSAE